MMGLRGTRNSLPRASLPMPTVRVKWLLPTGKVRKIVNHTFKVYNQDNKTQQGKKVTLKAGRPQRHQKRNHIAEERWDSKIKERLGEEIVVEKAVRVDSRSWFSNSAKKVMMEWDEGQSTGDGSKGLRDAQGHMMAQRWKVNG